MVVKTEIVSKQKRWLSQLLIIGATLLLLVCSTISAQAATVVSNAGQADDSTETNLISGERQAQRFTTGTTPYELTTVGFNIRNAAPDTTDTFTVSIQGESGGNPDGADLASQGVTTEDTAGVKTVDFSSANIILKPSTNYYVVFTYSGDATDTVALQTTTADAEDVGGTTGASINNDFHHYTSSAWTTITRAIEITISGDTGPVIYLTNTSDTGKSPHDNRTHDYTPTVTLSGFTGTINLTATASGETAVTASRSGDGDVTIPRLTPGKQWTITATDSASPTANTATLIVHIDNLLVGNRGINASLASFPMSPTFPSFAQKFTTTNGSYALEEVQYTVAVRAIAGENSKFTVSVQGANGSGNPDGNNLATINVDHDVIESSGVKTATLDTPLVLSANTDYFAVFTYSGSNVSLRTLGGGSRFNEDPSATGWSINNQRHYMQSATGNWVNDNQSIMKIALKGSLVPTKTATLHSDSDTGISQSDNITSDSTPDITVAGFEATDQVTVVATKVGTSTTVRSSEQTGNGTHTLPALSDGLWYITAENTLGDRTLRIAVTIDSNHPDLLVKNTGQTATNAGTTVGGSSGLKTAQQFTVGSEASLVKQVQYEVAGAVSDANETFTVSIQGTDGSGNPDGTKIVSVDVNHDDVESTGIKTATFATSATLTASTSYFVVFEYSGTTDSIAVAMTASDSEDTGGASGWSVANAYRAYDGSAWGAGGTNSAKIGLYGFAFRTDLKATSDTGISNTDNITSDNTPTIIVSGFASGATITVTADHATAADVTFQITGNGEDDLGTLADGEWSITASDTTHTTAPLVITVDTTPPTVAAPGALFTGHLSATDLFINKADDDAAAGDIFTALSGSGITYQYAVITLSATCDSTATFSNDIPQTDDVGADNTYRVCVKGTDIAGNTGYGASPSFTKDTTAPTLSQASSIGSTTNTTPDLSFSATEGGAVAVGGDCATTTVSVSAVSGTKTISLGPLTPATYANCTVTVTDAAGNASNTLSIPSFTITPLASVTLHHDSGAGDNIDTSSYTPDNLTADTTPKITLAGFTGSVNIRATHATADPVIASAPSNGDITLSELAEGEWAITAGDNGGNSDTLTITVLHDLATNTAESDDGTVRVGSDDESEDRQKIAQSFTTGTDGATLKEIHFEVTAETFSDRGKFEIELMTATGSPSRPGVRVRTGTCNIFNGIPRDSLAAGDYVFEVPANRNCVLQPNTEYFLVFQIKETGVPNAHLRTVSSDTQSGEDEWSLADACLKTTTPSYGASGTWSDCDSNRSLKIGLFGVPVPETHTIALKAASDSGSSDTDRVTNVSTPTITVGGFGNTANVVVTANHSDGVTSATGRRQGDGDVVMESMKDGVWTISATDTTDTTREIEVTIDTAAPIVTVPDTKFTGHLSSADLFINKADDDAAAQDLITALSDTGVAYQYAVIASSTSCGINVTFADGIPQTDDIPSADGTYKVCVKGTDTAGNIGYGASPTFTKDATAPSVTITNTIFRNALTTTNAYLNSAEATTNAAIMAAPTGSDSGGAYSFTYKVVSSNTDCDASVTYAAALPTAGFSGADGTYKVCVKVADVAGNIQYTATPTFTKDTTAPTLSNPSSIGQTANTTPDFTLSATEGGAVAVGGACSTTTTSVSVASGQKTISLGPLTPATYANCTVTVTDAAGNASNTLNIPSFAIVVPTITLHRDSGAGDNTNADVAADNLTADTTPKITLSNFIGTITLTAAHDGSAPAPNIPNATSNGDVVLPTLAEGQWTITATDSATTPNTATLIITILPKLVSNAGETNDGTVTVGDFDETFMVQKVAQAFTTGATTSRLREVQINISALNGVSSSASFEIELMTSDGGNPSSPSQRVRTGSCNIFNGIATSEVSAGTFTYEIPESKNCTLSPETEYFLVFQIKNRNSADIDLTAVSSDTQTGKEGWTIADQCRIAHIQDSAANFGAGGTWGNCAGGRSVKVELFGNQYAINLKESSDNGVSSTDNITNDNTPTITVSGYGNQATVTITASKSGSQSVTAQITGNGDKDLGTLTDGTWTISASDGTNVSNEIEVTIDTAAPSAPTGLDLATADDTGSNTSDNITKNTSNLTIAVTATGENGGTVQLYRAGSTTVGTATTISGGTASIDISLTQAVHSITAKTTDQAGNVSPASDPLSITVDTTAPTLSLPSSIGSTTNTTPDFSFTTTEGGAVAVAGDCSTTTASVSVASGQKTISLGPLTPATYANCTVTVTDTAGNASNTLNMPSFAIVVPTITLHHDSGAGDNIDTSSYTRDNLTSDTTPKITLSNFTGTITLTAAHDGSASAPNIPNATGNGDVVLPTLAEGQWTITATDSATTPNTDTLVITVLSKLSSNAGESNNGTVRVGSRVIFSNLFSVRQKIAQSFTTRGRRTLKEIHFSINSSAISSQPNGTNFEVELMTATGNPSRPGSRVTTDTCNIFGGIPNRSLVAGGYVLEIPASKNCVLEANTEYFLVFQIKNTKSVHAQLDTVSSDAQSGEDGWLLADACLITTNDGGGAAGTWNDCSSDRSLKIGLFGTLLPSTNLKESSDNGVSSTDNITNDNTPTITVSGYGNQATVTITASKSGSQPVTAQITGNGDKDLGTLTDGTWTISASDGTNVSNEIEVTIDTAAPSAPTGLDLATADDTGSNTSDNITKNTSNLTIAVTATGENGGTVQLYRAGSTTVGTATTISGGTASIDISLTQAVHSITAKTTDQAGNVSPASDPLSITVDTTAPTVTIAVAQFTGHLSPTDHYIDKADDDDTTPEDLITAPSEAGTTYQYKVITSSTDCDEDVTFTDGVPQTDDIPSADGTYKVCVKGTDTAGNIGYGASPTFTKDATAPSVTITNTIFRNALTTTNTYINSAEATTNAAIMAAPTGSDSGGAYSFSYKVVSSNTDCDASVTYAAALPTAGFSGADGTYKVCVKVADVAGNIQYTATPTFTKDTTVPVISNFNSPSSTVYTRTPSISFTSSEAGKTRANAGCKIPEVTVVLGANTVTLNTLSVGAYGSSCSLVIVDTAGNPSAGTAIPDFTVANTGIGVAMDNNAWSKTRVATATVTGSSPSNLNWVLFDPNAQPAQTCGSGLTFPSSQSYTSGNAVTVTSTDADNGKKVCFRATVGGNTFYQASDAIARVDTTAPSAPTGLDLAAADDTGSSQTDNITKNTSNLTIAVTATGENGGTVQLYRAGNTAIGTATTISGGTASIDISLTQAVHSITAKTTDQAGNVSPASDPLSITVDTTAPAKPTAPDLATGDDTGSSNSDNITSDTTPTISTTAVANATYEWIIDGTIDPNFTGNIVAITTPLTQSNHTFSVKVTDRAGNQSVDSDTLAITVDTTAPTVTIAVAQFTGHLSPTDHYIDKADDDDTTPEDLITAPSEAGTTYQYKVITSSTDCDEDVTFADGIPQTDDIPSADGTYKVCVKGTDTAGNIGYGASPTFTKDATTPSVTITNTIFRNALSTTNTYLNSAEATTNAAIMAAPTGSDSGGAYSFTYKVVSSNTACDASVTYAAALPTAGFSGADGTYKVCVKVTDVAGNIQYTATPTFTKDTTVPVISGFSGPSGTIYTRTPSISFTSSEAGKTRANAGCKIPEVTVASGTNTVTFNTLSVGAYGSSCSLVIVDTAGNPSAGTAITTFTVADTGIAITMDTTTWTTSRTATATVTGSSPSNLNWVLFDPNAQPAQTCGSGLTFPSSQSYTSGNAVTVTSTDTDNGKKVCFRATVGGNTFYQASDAIARVDTTAPSAPGGIDLASVDDTGSNTSDNITKQTENLTITVAAGAGESGGTAQLYNGSTAVGSATTITGSTATIDISLAEGTHAITAKTTDQAGNVSPASDPLSITVDTTVPEIAVSDVSSPHVKADGTMTFTLTLSDTNQIKPGTYTFTATGGTLATCEIIAPANSNSEETSCTITTASATDGTAIVLTIPALTDAAGNTKATQQETLGYVDTQAPDIETLTLDASEKKKLTITLSATAPQHASNTYPETVTLMLSGSCEVFNAEKKWVVAADNNAFEDTLTLSVPKGDYENCIFTLQDEAGNISRQIARTFTIRGEEEGGVANIGGSVSGMIASVSDIFNGGDGGGGREDTVEQEQEQSQSRGISFIETIDDIFDGGGGQAQTEQPQQSAIQTAPILSEALGQQAQVGQQTLPEAVAASIDTLTFVRDLTVGSVGSDVRTLQALLNSLGFIISSDGPGSPGQESEYFGERTRQALIRYQEANGIVPASGYFGPITRAFIQGERQPQQAGQAQGEISRLPPTEQDQEIVSPVAQGEQQTLVEEVAASVDTRDFVRDLTIGSVGEDVRSLQVLLNALGFTVSESGPGSPGEESAYFGERTRQALITYQQANGITPANGYFGPITRAFIQRERGSGSSDRREVESSIEQVEQESSQTDLTEQEQQSIQEASPFVDVVEQEEEEEIQEQLPIQQAQPQQQAQPAPQPQQQAQPQSIMDTLYRDWQPSFNRPSNL